LGKKDTRYISRTDEAETGMGVESISRTDEAETRMGVESGFDDWKKKET
jgi:hypothetical protein